MMLALAGRVPVKVSTENGPIQTGDFLTPSSIPGVAMKATKAGQVIGQALMPHVKDGEIGSVVMFINNTYYQGQSRVTILPPGVVADSMVSSTQPQISSRDLLVDLARGRVTYTSTTPISEIFTDRVISALEIITPSVITDKLIANTLEAGTQDFSILLAEGGRLIITTSTATSSESSASSSTPAISFDSLGNAFFAGTVTADTVRANQIEGLSIFTDKLGSLSSRLSNLADFQVSMSSTLASTTLAMASSAQFAYGLEVNSSSTFNGDVLVAGDLVLERGLRVSGPVTMEKLTAADFSSPAFDSISSTLYSLSASFASTTEQITSTLYNFGLELAATKAALETMQLQFASSSATSGLAIATTTFPGSLEVHGATRLYGGLFVDSVGSLGEKVTFLGDVHFFGRPYFNADSGGFVVMTSGTQFAEVVFEREYLAQPVINISISLEAPSSTSTVTSTEAVEHAIFENDIRYLVSKKSTNGFTIKLNKPAPADVTFSWIALAVQDARIILSTSSVATTTPVAIPESSSTTSLVDESSVTSSTPATSTPPDDSSTPPTDSSTSTPLNEPAVTPPPSEPSAPEVVPTAPETSTPTPENTTPVSEPAAPTDTTASPESSPTPPPSEPAPAP